MKNYKKLQLQEAEYKRLVWLIKDEVRLLGILRKNKKKTMWKIKQLRNPMGNLDMTKTYDK